MLINSPSHTGYILGQIPSNLILAKSRPSIYLSCCVLVWGVVSLCTGFVQNLCVALPSSCTPRCLCAVQHLLAHWKSCSFDNTFLFSAVIN